MYLETVLTVCVRTLTCGFKTNRLTHNNNNAHIMYDLSIVVIFYSLIYKQKNKFNQNSNNDLTSTKY